MPRSIHASSRFTALSVLLATLGLAACGGGDGSSATATSRLRLSVTDAPPVDIAEELWVQFRAVEFKPEGGAPITHVLATPDRINLLPLQDGRAAVLVGDVELPAGRYQWIRLIVDNELNVSDSSIRIDGNECELRIPSGSESGLKLIRGFTLPADGTLALTVDFDLRKSILAPPGQKGSGVDCTQGYLMKPVLRLVQDSEVGAIAGTVDPSLFSAADCARLVYVFSDGTAPAGGADLDDYGDTEPNPEQMARVDPVTGAYRASFLPAGNYTLAFTCSPDDMELDTDVLAFTEPQGATVQRNLVSVVDFAP